MSDELFGQPKATLEDELLRVTGAWIANCEAAMPPRVRDRKDGGKSYFSWNMRSCQHYVTELPLRYFAHGPQPWESQCEEAQGKGRLCMKQSMGLTSRRTPTHNLLAISCFAVSVSILCWFNDSSPVLCSINTILC